MRQKSKYYVLTGYNRSKKILMTRIMDSIDLVFETINCFSKQTKYKSAGDLDFDIASRHSHKGAVILETAEVLWSIYGVQVLGEVDMTESILDKPQDGLCPDVWEYNDSTNSWSLRSNVFAWVSDVFDWAVNKYQLLDAECHITGSITSNSYRPTSDIDIHIYSPYVDPESAEELNKIIKADFQENFCDMYANCKVGTHPFEVYIQTNKWQDYMSVGCYDVLNSTWLVGPELKATNYDPMSEYFDANMKSVKSIIKDVRSSILAPYELLIAYQNSDRREFKSKMIGELLGKIQQAIELYDQMRKMRKVYSSPKSKEQALEWRNSAKWKIADSTFKLMDKFGYLAVLKSFKEALESFATNPNSVDDVLTHLAGVAKDTVAKSLKDSELSLIANESELNEDVAGGIKASILASLLAIPGICSADQIKPALSSKEPVKAVERVRDKASPKKDFSGYSYSHATNIVALTLFWEAQNQGHVGIDMVASVILNRCKGDETKLPLACLKNAYSSKAKCYVWQFSCWNEKGIHKIRRTTQKAANYRIFIPREVKAGKVPSLEIWKYCNEVAVKLCGGKFKTLGNWTEYYNPKTANPDWAAELTSVKTVGSHRFGILKRHAAYI